MRIRAIVILSLSILACQSTTPMEPEPLLGKIGENIDIPYGRTVQISDDGGLEVKFFNVEDSRCIYTGITCVWSGNAVVILQIDGEALSLNTATPYPKDVMVEGYAITLLALAPYETDTWPIQKKQYVATIRVTQ